jgi:hypothetical protein
MPRRRVTLADPQLVLEPLSILRVNPFEKRALLEFLGRESELLRECPTDPHECPGADRAQHHGTVASSIHLRQSVIQHPEPPLLLRQREADREFIPTVDAQHVIKQILMVGRHGTPAGADGFTGQESYWHNTWPASSAIALWAASRNPVP